MEEEEEEVWSTISASCYSSVVDTCDQEDLDDITLLEQSALPSAAYYQRCDYQPLHLIYPMAEQSSSSTNVLLSRSSTSPQRTSIALAFLFLFKLFALLFGMFPFPFSSPFSVVS